MRTTVWVKQTETGVRVTKLPAKDHLQVWAEWDTASHAVIDKIDEQCRRINKGLVTLDHEKRRELIWKELLTGASWFDLQREAGDISQDQQTNYIDALEPKVANALVEILEETLFIGRKEEREILRQAIVLFKPNSGGLRNPHPTIKKYCDAAMFWEKFGLRAYSSLSDMPQEDYIRFKHMNQLEAERKEWEYKKMMQQHEQRAKQI